MSTAASCSRYSSAAMRPVRCGRTSLSDSMPWRTGSARWALPNGRISPKHGAAPMERIMSGRNLYCTLRANAAAVAGLALLPGTALAATTDALLPRNLSPWGMFVNADVVVRAVMIGLAFASLVTWTIWLAKTIELRLAAGSVRRRLKMLESGPQLSEALRACEGARDAVAQLVLSTGREAELSDF